MLGRLGVWGASVVAAVAGWAAPALAQPPAPDPGAAVESLRAEPARVQAGDLVKIAGRGCRPGERVDVTVFGPRPQPAGTLLASAAGMFAATVRLPADAQPGRLWIRATCPGADARPWVLDATLALRSPAVVITWVNVLFGLGAALTVAGFGIAGRRRPARGKRRRRPPGVARLRLRPLARRRRKRRRTARAGRRRAPGRVRAMNLAILPIVRTSRVGPSPLLEPSITGKARAKGAGSGERIGDQLAVRGDAGDQQILKRVLRPRAALVAVERTAELRILTHRAKQGRLPEMSAFGRLFPLTGFAG